MKKDEVLYNIKFLKIIKNKPCIWNFKLSDYSKRDVVARAWKEVCKEANDTELNCRDRWRTLRNSYIKSLRSKKTSYDEKKKYYLTDYFKFLLPFIKHSDGKKGPHIKHKITKSEDDDDYSTCSEENNSVDALEAGGAGDTGDADDADDAGDPDDAGDTNDAGNSHEANAEQSNGVDNKKSKKEISEENAAHYKRPRDSYSNITDGDKDYEEWLKYKKCKYTEDDSDELFVRSLIKYMKEMNSRQNRRFRLKVMGLVDAVLDESDGEMEKLNATTTQSYTSHIPIVVDTIKQTHPVLSALYSAEAPQKQLILPQQVVYYDDDDTNFPMLRCTKPRPASIH